MAWLLNLLHSSHFPGCEPDLDAVWMGGRVCEDVFHDAASELPAALIVLLRDVHSQPRLDVFAVLTVHALASFALRKWRTYDFWFHGILPSTVSPFDTSGSRLACHDNAMLHAPFSCALRNSGCSCK